MALEQQLALPHRLQRPPDRLDVGGVERAVGVLDVDPVADPLGQRVPVLEELEHRLAALLVELGDAVALDVVLGLEPELLLDRDLHRQAVAVPAALALDVLAEHRLVAGEDVLEHAGEHVVRAGAAVRGRRALVEHELLGALAAADRLAEDVALAPALEHLLLEGGEVGGLGQRPVRGHGRGDSRSRLIVPGDGRHRDPARAARRRRRSRVGRPCAGDPVPVPARARGRRRRLPAGRVGDRGRARRDLPRLPAAAAARGRLALLPAPPAHLRDRRDAAGRRPRPPHHRRRGRGRPRGHPRPELGRGLRARRDRLRHRHRRRHRGLPPPRRARARRGARRGREPRQRRHRARALPHRRAGRGGGRVLARRRGARFLLVGTGGAAFGLAARLARAAGCAAASTTT